MKQRSLEVGSKCSRAGRIGGLWREIAVATGDENRLAFEFRVSREADLPAVDDLDLLDPVDVHLLAFELLVLFGEGSGFIEVPGGHEEVYMVFVDSIEKLSIIEAAMNEIEIHDARNLIQRPIPGKLPKPDREPFSGSRLAFIKAAARGGLPL